MIDRICNKNATNFSNNPIKGVENCDIRRKRNRSILAGSVLSANRKYSFLISCLLNMMRILTRRILNEPGDSSMSLNGNAKITDLFHRKICTGFERIFVGKTARDGFRIGMRVRETVAANDRVHPTASSSFVMR